MFTREQIDRYARHIVLPGVGAEGQRRLLGARVVVLGAGGLGSPVLLYLAASGVGRIDVIDDDRVDGSNLQRQIVHRDADRGRSKAVSAAEALRALRPDLDVRAVERRLEGANARELIRGADLAVGGSDDFASRYALNDACVAEGVPLLHGAIERFEGQVALLADARPDGTRGACYRCVVPAPPPPEATPSCAEAGVFGAMAGVVGSMMAVEAVKRLVAGPADAPRAPGDPGEGWDSLADVLIHYDALAQRLHRVRLRRDPACPACGDEAYETRESTNATQP